MDSKIRKRKRNEAVSQKLHNPLIGPRHQRMKKWLHEPKWSYIDLFESSIKGLLRSSSGLNKVNPFKFVPIRTQCDQQRWERTSAFLIKVMASPTLPISRCPPLFLAKTKWQMDRVTITKIESLVFDIHIWILRKNELKNPDAED